MNGFTQPIAENVLQSTTMAFFKGKFLCICSRYLRRHFDESLLWLFSFHFLCHQLASTYFFWSYFWTNSGSKICLRVSSIYCQQ